VPHKKPAHSPESSTPIDLQKVWTHPKVESINSYDAVGVAGVFGNS
jgi:hypothetical protein